MKYKELSNMTEAEALAKLLELKELALKLRRDIALSREKQNHKLKAARKDIARILTHIGRLTGKK